MVFKLSEDNLNIKESNTVIVSTNSILPDYVYYSIISLILGLLLVLIVFVVSKVIKTSDDEIWEYQLYINSEWIKEGNFINETVFYCSEPDMNVTFF